MLGKIGKYGAATLEYGGLKTAAFVKKAVNIVSGTITGTAFRTNKDNNKQKKKFKDTLKFVPRLTVEAGKYTYAVVEYAGLMVYVLLKRGSEALISPIVIAIRSKGKLITNFNDNAFIGINKELLANIGEASGNFFKGIRNFVWTHKTVDPELSEKITRIETMLVNIEAILKNIEQHGVISTPSGYSPDKPKLKEDAKMLLASILQTNLDLRD